MFFSDEKMREREPLLYDRMVGRYLSDDGGLSYFIYEHLFTLVP